MAIITAGLAVAALPSSAFAMRAIKITNISDLNFGTATQGDPPKTIPAGVVDNLDNASFEVTGDNNGSFTIVLPTSPVTMTTGQGGAGRTLTLSNFQSYPSGGVGVLDRRGQALLLVGATRSGVALNQSAGAYSGIFTVVVVY